MSRSGWPADGAVDAARDVAGITGIGLLRAATAGGGLSWTGPTAYPLAAVHAG